MISKEPKAMEEIHRIREEIHAETKGMNIHEKMMFISKSAESFKSKYKIKTMQGKEAARRRAANE